MYKTLRTLQNPQTLFTEAKKKVLGPEIPEDAKPVLAILADKRSAVLALGEQVYAKIKAEEENGRTPGNPKISLGTANFGGYHVLFPIQADGVTVLQLKVPMTGTKETWTHICQRSLETEARTMMLLHNSIPVPKVYNYSPTLDNAIGCPYIVMAHVAGLPLYDVWFGHQISPRTVSAETTRQCRIRALDGIAEAMAKLGQFAFSEAGAPVFDDQGSIVGIGPSRFVDSHAMQDGNPYRQEPGYFTRIVRKLAGAARTAGAALGCNHNRQGESGESGAQIGAEKDTTIYTDWGPTTDPKQYYTRAMDANPARKRFESLETLLRMLIAWMPEPRPSGDPHSVDRLPFVLAHPDFDVQNFIVAKDGTLLAIIDWDGVEAVPRSIGNEVVPGWLTRDWDPIMYRYDSRMEDEKALLRGYTPKGVWEDSAATLARYRGIYVELIAKHAGRHAARAECVARRSLLSDNLSIAASEPVCCTMIMEKLSSEMWKAYRDSNGEGDSDGDGDSDSDGDGDGDGDGEGEGDSDGEESGAGSVAESVLYPSFFSIALMHQHDEMQPDLLERLEQAFQALLRKIDGA